GQARRAGGRPARPCDRCRQRQVRRRRRRGARICYPGLGRLRTAQCLRGDLIEMSTAVMSGEAKASTKIERISTARLLGINTMWFGQGAHWPPINFVLLPFMATLIAGRSASLLIGRVSAAGNLFALLAPLLAGWLSDPTSTRWRRRRSWILAVTSLTLVGLA